jgi:hypothetical protein
MGSSLTRGGEDQRGHFQMTSSFSSLCIPQSRSLTQRLAYPLGLTLEIATLLTACETPHANPGRDAGKLRPGDAGSSTPMDSGVETIDAPQDIDAARDAGKQPDAARVPEDPQPNPECVGLFGKPNQATGLDDTQCSPVCTCDGQVWSPPDYSAATIASLKSWTLTNPFAAVDADPYDSASPPEPTNAVCGVLPEPGAARVYSLVTYPSSTAAHSAGAIVTHTGACGTCSTLTDLSVYIANQDLTEPVRRCGLDHTLSGKEAHIACLQELGFTLPCAQSWYFNTLHTRKECGAICLLLVRAPYNREDGRLNACLQCDEDKSGAVFKAVAGRTRRNSGLANAMCRPCSEVSRVEHIYE